LTRRRLTVRKAMPGCLAAAGTAVPKSLANSKPPCRRLLNGTRHYFSEVLARRFLSPTRGFLPIRRP
jgi:hypothetical protein